MAIKKAKTRLFKAKSLSSLSIRAITLLKRCAGGSILPHFLFITLIRLKTSFGCKKRPNKGRS
jgi:hypothetical protein